MSRTADVFTDFFANLSFLFTSFPRSICLFRRFSASTRFTITLVRMYIPTILSISLVDLNLEVSFNPFERLHFFRCYGLANAMHLSTTISLREERSPEVAIIFEEIQLRPICRPVRLRFSVQYNVHVDGKWP